MDETVLNHRAKELLREGEITRTLKFLEQYDHGGEGDYTAEKYMHEEPKPTDEEIRRMFGF